MEEIIYKTLKLIKDKKPQLQEYKDAKQEKHTQMHIVTHKHSYTNTLSPRNTMIRENEAVLRSARKKGAGNITQGNTDKN